MKFQAAKGSYWENYVGRVGEWVDVSFFKYVFLKIFGYKVRVIKDCYFHNYSKPIISRYISFNTRDIIFECKCGKRKIKRISRLYGLSFPIETTYYLNKENFKKHLTTNKNGKEKNKHYD